MTDVGGWIYLLGESMVDPNGVIYDTAREAREGAAESDNGALQVWRVPITAHLDRATVVEDGQES